MIFQSFTETTSSKHSYPAASSIESTDPNLPAVSFQEISPNGKIAIGPSAPIDSSGLWVWTLSGNKATPTGRIPNSYPAVFSGDSTTLVAIVQTQTQVIDLSDPAAPRLVTTLPVAVAPTAVADDGRSFVGKVMEVREGSVFPDDEADALLWNLSDPARPVSTRLPCKSVGDPAIRPDGRVVTAVCEDSPQHTVIRSWHVEPDGLREVKTQQGDRHLRVSYSPTGRFLLIRRRLDLDTQVWDSAAEHTPSLWTTFSEFDGPSRALWFGRDDQVAIESTSQGLTLWDISVKGRMPVRLASFRGFEGNYASARYRPEHKDFIATVGRADRPLWRFPLSADHAKTALCARGNVELSDDEWERFLYGVERTSVC